MRSPVLLLCYNRPLHFQMALKRLEESNCRRLYISRDGPAGLMDKAFQAEMDSVLENFNSTTMEIKINFLQSHVGLKNAVLAGIDWVFRHEVEAIILEDDIVAAPEFFSYCDDALEDFRNDQNIWHVAGYNPSVWLSRILSPRSKTRFLSSRVHIWGWATWSSRWQAFRLAEDTIENPNILNYFMRTKSLGSTMAFAEYSNGKRLVDEGKIDTWDYLWATFVLKVQGKAVSPRGRLTTNEGFGPAATHTKTGTQLPLRPLGSSGARSRTPGQLRLYDLGIGILTFVKGLRKRLVRLISKPIRPLYSRFSHRI